MRKISFLTFGVLTFFINLVSAHTGDGDGFSGGHSMVESFSGMWGMNFIWLILLVLVIISLVLLIIWLVKKINEPESRRNKK